AGPAPVLATTAVCGRISSQLMKSTRTATPVASVYFLVFSRQYTSSGSMNFAGRSTRSWAPFSSLYSRGLTLAVGTSVTAARAPMVGMDAAAIDAEASASDSRRLMVMLWAPYPVISLWSPLATGDLEPLAANYSALATER